MIQATDIKRGQILDMDGAPWLVLESLSQTPSARGASLLIKVKLRNLATGNVLAKTFRGGDQVEAADCERRPIQFLYHQDEDYSFMDTETYDQFMLTTEVLGDAAGYLVDGLEARSLMYNGAVLAVELPTTVDLVVEDTAPALKGATAQAQLKPALLETGITIQVPPYITTGERVKVDTRDGRFVERAKD
jgi:elongation factor P